MSGRARAKVLVGAAIVFGTSASIGVGTANAVDAPRQAALIGICGGSVSGAPGTPVQVSIAGQGLVTIGTVPQSGSAVLQLDGVPVVGGLLGATGLCKVTATAVETVAPVLAPVTDPVSQVAGTTGVSSSKTAATTSATAAAPVPGAVAAPLPAAGPFVPANFDLSGSPQRGAFNFSGAGLYDYSSLLGGAAKFGELQYGDLFNGYSPEFGILGAEDDSAARDVAAAGRAQALDSEGTDRIALPVLVAVLMLSGVTAALLRSWVHGAARTAPS